MDYNVVKQSTVDVKIKQKDLIINLHINVNDSFNVDDLLTGLDKAKGCNITGYSIEKEVVFNHRNMVKFNIIFDDKTLSVIQYPDDLGVYVNGMSVI